MIADDSPFGELKINLFVFTAKMADKKTPPGGERFRGGVKKGAGILRMETIVPRQLLNFMSKHHAKVLALAIFPCEPLI